MDGFFFARLWWRSLRGRTDWHRDSSRRLGRAAIYLARALSLPIRHQRFLRLLHGHPLLCACVRRDPRLQERHMHRFVNRHWHRRQRLSALREHYRLLLRQWPVALFEAVYVRECATLGELVLKDGGTLHLRLLPPIDKGCEGELILELAEADQRPLYRLMLTLIDARTLAIGCLQGTNGEQSRERVRALTRQMHGMRPKQLMMELAYAFADRHGLDRLLAIGSAAHPLRGRDCFVVDYDAYWRELGGEPAQDGWFAMPPALPHRDVAQVESKHRAAFRRRAELRMAAAGMLAAALDPPSSRHEAATTAPALESPASSPQKHGEASWIGLSKHPAVPA